MRNREGKTKEREPGSEAYGRYTADMIFLCTKKNCLLTDNLHSLLHRIINHPSTRSVPPFSHLTFCTPTKSKFPNSLATVLNEPDM
jgi:hypothetical protein